MSEHITECPECGQECYGSSGVCPDCFDGLSHGKYYQHKQCRSQRAQEQRQRIVDNLVNAE